MSRSGLSPAAVSSAEAVWVPTPLSATSVGAHAAVSSARCSSSVAVSSVRASQRRASVTRVTFAAAVGLSIRPGRRRAARSTISVVVRPLNEERRSSGAVPSTAWSWLAAWVRALMALRRATWRSRIASTSPAAVFGVPLASPDRTARASRTLSSGPHRRPGSRHPATPPHSPQQRHRSRQSCGRSRATTHALVRSRCSAHRRRPRRGQRATGRDGVRARVRPRPPSDVRAAGSPSASARDSRPTSRRLVPRRSTCSSPRRPPSRCGSSCAGQPR